MTPFVQDADFTLYVGDALEVLATLPDESVHTCVTSPPYWGLRDYGTEGQLGLEATPDLFVAAIVDVFREVRRVLRSDGTLWLNLGDSYNSSPSNQNGATSVSLHGGNTAAWETQGRQKRDVSGLKPKDMVGIPWRVAFALQADGWYLRSDIVWSKPNPMPESVTDRPTKAHEYVFLLSKSPRYFFDQEAVRESYTGPDDPSKFRFRYGAARVITDGAERLGDRAEPGRTNGAPVSANGRNLRSVWEIATQPYPDAHFATFPEALPERCIKAGTSERGCCPVCGAPWVRVIVATGADNDRVREDVGDWIKHKGGNADGKRSLSGSTYKPQRAATDEWRPTCATACGASDERFNTSQGQPSHGSADGADAAHSPVPCAVLDPFMGSGTSALVARRLGRRSIGIELNPEYAALCARRLQQLSLLSEEQA